MKGKKQVVVTLLLSIMTLLMLAACGGAVDEPTADAATPTAEGNEAVTPVEVDMEDVEEEVEEAGDGELEEMPAPGIPDPEAFMSEQVRIALSERLGVDMDAVSVEGITETEWPDASLGCPAEGEMYAQVVTPGYEIVLSVDGETYSFHTDNSGAMVLCDDEGRPVSEDS